MVEKFNNHKKQALFIGRWQPFHNGHKWLIDKALVEGKNVCIAIRDTEISDKNPYNVEQRKEMIKRIYNDKVKTITIPDIESIRIGRNVGYEVIEEDPPEHIGNISGTNVREKKETSVHPEVEHYVKLLKSTIWLTGLPCSGKTSIAIRLKEEIENKGYNVVHIDGDHMRAKLNEDLGFSHEHRKENLRRIAHISQLFNDHGNIVIASFITPLNDLRKMIYEIIDDIKTVYLKCPLEVCEARDVKGMYAKARAGEISEFTGVSAPFEEPENPHMVLNTAGNDIETCVEQILTTLKL